MLARMWRLFVALFDWRTTLRVLCNRPTIDVVFVTNMRDSTDRKRFLGGWRPPEGHFNGPRYWFGNIAGRTRALDVTAEDLFPSPSTMRLKLKKEKTSGDEVSLTVKVEKRSAVARAVHNKAQKQFVSAVRWAKRRGARVVLLAAGTKRLFGPHGSELKMLFPDTVFTIGDNGTMWLLRSETNRALQAAGLVPGTARVCVIGPTGFLGELMVKSLVGLGYETVGLCGNAGSVKQCDIEAYASFEEVGKVDAVIACTHAEAVCLTPETVEILRKPERKLLVVDVAEPSNMKRSDYRECRNVVVRQDAGNAYSPRLQYVLGAASYRLFRLTRGVTFGCFAEAMVIAAKLADGDKGEILSRDWFTVSEENIKAVERMFAEYGFNVPSPRCFGEPVTSFDLRL